MKNICYKNKGQLSAGVIIAGWDRVDGGSIYNVVMGGSCLKQTLAVGGSGSLFIYGLLDAEFRPGMSEDEARTLVKKAISHAMARDGSSGGMVRTMTVKEEGNRRDVTPGNALPFGPKCQRATHRLCVNVVNQWYKQVRTTTVAYCVYNWITNTNKD